MLPRILTPEANGGSSGAAKPRVRLDPSHAGNGEDVFKGALLETAIQKRKPLDWVISLGAHTALIAAVVIVPLLVTQRMDLGQYETTYLTAPPLMAPPPPLGAMRQPERKQTFNLAKLTMPVSIPKIARTVKENGPESAPDLSATLTDGVAGGLSGGVLGGILGGTGTVVPPRPTATVGSSKPLQVGGEVKPPHLLYDPAPEYPWLARQAQVQGDVEIDAVVDKYGNVVQMHALDGPPLLVAAALKAVSQWKYQPTYLNGAPYPVELMVDVVFHLS